MGNRNNTPANTAVSNMAEPFGRIPTKWFANLIKQIESASHSDQINDLLVEISHRFGLSYITYGTNICASFTCQTIFVLSNNASKWRTYYEENGLIAHDPRIIEAKRNITPFIWSNIKTNTPEEKKVLDDLQEFGFAEGMTFPVRNARNDFGFINTAYFEPQKKMASRIAYLTPYISLLASYIHEKAHLLLVNEYKSKDSSPSPLDVRLSNRERECLIWLADGKTTWEISQILGITESTVNQHLGSSGTKLNANNRTHMIAKAISLKFIAPNYKKKAIVRYLHK